MFSDEIPAVSGVYRILCSANRRVYVGSATNLRRRWVEHRSQLTRKVHHNRILQRAWDKHGEDAFSFEVLELVLLPELLTLREQHWIDTLKPFGHKGFNLAPNAGSNLGWKHDIIARAKMSAAQIGNTKNLGKKASPETRKKMSALKKGKQPWLGKKHSPESIAKMSAVKKGRKRKPEEYSHRMKMFIAISPTGDEYHVRGIRAFCMEHGIDHTALIRVAQGKQRQHKGWTARYPGTDIN